MAAPPAPFTQGGQANLSLPCARGGVSEADGGVVKRQSPFHLEHIVPLTYNVRNISVSSIRNEPFHIDTEVPKGGVWQGRTVALAISGQKTSSFPKKFNCKGGDKDKRKSCTCAALGDRIYYEFTELSFIGGISKVKTATFLLLSCSSM